MILDIKKEEIWYKIGDNIIGTTILGMIPSDFKYHGINQNISIMLIDFVGLKMFYSC